MENMAVPSRVPEFNTVYLYSGQEDTATFRRGHPNLNLTGDWLAVHVKERIDVEGKVAWKEPLLPQCGLVGKSSLLKK